MVPRQTEKKNGKKKEECFFDLFFFSDLFVLFAVSLLHFALFFYLFFFKERKVSDGESNQKRMKGKCPQRKKKKKSRSEPLHTHIKKKKLQMPLRWSTGQYFFLFFSFLFFYLRPKLLSNTAIHVKTECYELFFPRSPLPITVSWCLTRTWTCYTTSVTTTSLIGLSLSFFFLSRFFFISLLQTRSMLKPIHLDVTVLCVCAYEPFSLFCVCA